MERRKFFGSLFAPLLCGAAVGSENAASHSKTAQAPIGATYYDCVFTSDEDIVVGEGTYVNCLFDAHKSLKK